MSPISRSRRGGGQVIVYTGGGKGKTTAALGLAVRAIGYGWRVCMIQFIKGSWKYGEVEGVKRLAPNFELIVAGRGFVGILDDKLPLSEHKEAAEEALEISRGKVLSGKYDIVILDELNYALSLKLVRLRDILELIRMKPPKVTVVITGDKAHRRLIEVADIVTEMKEIKHPFRKGLPGKRGIDF